MTSNAKNGQAAPGLHLIKLSVGSDSPDSLRAWQAGRLKQAGRLWHRTRMMPRRAEEILAGGSIFWVIKGALCCRQRVVGFERVTDGEGRPDTHILLDPELVEVWPRVCRPFQGWRYLKPEDAPADLREGGRQGMGEMPQEMLLELQELGVL